MLAESINDTQTTGHTQSPHVCDFSGGERHRLRSFVGPWGPNAVRALVFLDEFPSLWTGDVLLDPGCIEYLGLDLGRRQS